ncbi:MAG: hypothetical protein ACI8W8_001692 [Rhodothermales bacterium]|jgi:hypothetical protein
MSLRQQVNALWCANITFTVALYVPMIDLYLCDLIGFLILWRMHRRLPADAPDEFRPVGWLAAISISGAIALSGLATAQRAEENLNLLILPIVLVYFAVTLKLYWHYMGGAAELAERLKQEELANYMRGSRVPFILTSIGLLFFMSALHASTFPEPDTSLRGELIDMAMMMPAVWCLNWFFLLRPMIWLRRALPAEEPAA